MKPVLGGFVLAVIVVAAIASAQQPPPRPAQPAAGLRIVVVEGEDAVNIVQQKTAVRPLVEVRDSNNLPVAGATVQFTLQTLGGAANTASFANGQTAFTVTTNAAGRAASPQLQALGRGALRINVQASYQGQVATTTVSQTNFATVAEATQAGKTPTSSSSGGASGTGSGAAGGGAGAGGVAGTVAGIAAAGISAAVAVNQAATDSNCSSSNNIFMSDLSAAENACLNNGASAVCTTAGQQAANSLGEWCSCAGAAAVEASLQAIGTNLAELTSLAGFPGVQIPPSCSQ
jgi:hypothetical protein